MEIRLYQDKDMPFLTHMLYEAVYWRSIAQGTNPPIDEGVSVPSVWQALENWGARAGDTAVIALKDSARAGAAWFRYYTASRSIRGYIDDSTLVVVLAVHRDYRRLGIGLQLVEQLIEVARVEGIQRLSLMVSNDNHALGLYQKCGFELLDEVDSSSLMVLQL
ncbi:MAG: GNAT family N-acetyltransferase [Deinococcota bacterium]